MRKNKICVHILYAAPVFKQNIWTNFFPALFMLQSLMSTFTCSNCICIIIKTKKQLITSIIVHFQNKWNIPTCNCQLKWVTRLWKGACYYEKKEKLVKTIYYNNWHLSFHILVFKNFTLYQNERTYRGGGVLRHNGGAFQRGIKESDVLKKNIKGVVFKIFALLVVKFSWYKFINKIILSFRIFDASKNLIFSERGNLV